MFRLGNFSRSQFLLRKNLRVQGIIVVAKGGHVQFCNQVINFKH